MVSRSFETLFGATHMKFVKSIEQVIEFLYLQPIAIWMIEFMF